MLTRPRRAAAGHRARRADRRGHRPVADPGRCTRREAAELGLPLRYHLIDLDELAACRRTWSVTSWPRPASGYRGLNVTHPCKQVVLAHLDELSPDAAALGAVNTVVFARRARGRAQHRLVRLRARPRRRAAGRRARHRRPARRRRGRRRGGPRPADAGRRAARVSTLDADRRASSLADARASGSVADPSRRRRRRARARRSAVADGLVHATPTGMAAHPGLPLPRRAAAPGSVGRRHRLPAARDRAGPRRARRRAAGCSTAAAWRFSRRPRRSRLFTGIEPGRRRGCCATSPR